MILQLRAWRELRNLTQQELADLAGVTQPTVSRIEAGDGANTRTLERIATALSVTVADLWKAPAVEVPAGRQ